MKTPLVFQHSGILDRENWDSNCRLPLEMIIFAGKSTSEHFRKLKKFRLRRLLLIINNSIDEKLILQINGAEGAENFWDLDVRL